MSEQVNQQKGLIGFFIRNSVAANLMMWFIIILGLIAYVGMNKQLYPDLPPSQIEISVNYFGVSGKEVEQNVIVKIEDRLRDLPEIKRLRSWSNDNNGRLIIELNKDADAADVLDKVKLRIDSIASFPAQMDPIVVNLLENYQPVIRLALVGDMDYVDLKPYAQTIERELLNLKNVSVVNTQLPGNEIAIEIDPMALRMYQLSTDDIRARLGAYSENISAGQLRAETGNIALRVEQQGYDVVAFENIPLITAANGYQVKLKDVAKVKDSFIEGVHVFTYSDTNAVFIEVQSVLGQDMSAVAESVRNYVRYKNGHLPGNMTIETIIDGTRYLDERLSMMEENLLQGAVLVLLMLGLFLSFRLAFWVVVGLPVCFLGATLLMPVFGVSINIISLFAFIMVLGLVVDDAIVVGESVHHESDKNGFSRQNVEAGVRKVAKPAIFGVLTTIAVFVPFLFGDGAQSNMFKGIATIVILCLVFSLLESKLILPAHLAHSRHNPPKVGGFKHRFNARLQAFTEHQLARAVGWSIARKWSMLLLFVCTLVVSAALLMFGHVRSIADPKVPIDQPEIKVELHDNASQVTYKAAVAQLDAMVKQVEAETVKTYGKPMVQSILIESTGQSEFKMTVPLVDEGQRPYSTFELSKRWREHMPQIVALKSVQIKDDVLGRNKLYGDFGYYLYSDDIAGLNQAAKALITELKQLPGVYEVSSTISTGKKELLMRLKPVANTLGLALADIGRQLAQSHFGAEVERFNRNGEEVRVLVRYQKDIRASISELQYARIYTPDGQEVMLGDMVEFSEHEVVTTIRREGGKRSIYVFGSVDQQQANINKVVAKVKREILPQLLKGHPGITTQLGGNIKETMAEQDQMLLFSIAAMLMVYTLLAVPLKSYVQPFLIMSIIPFCVVGAIWGHWLFAEDFSLVSMFGLVAAAGVVVNDSLILVDRINQKMAEGFAVVEGVVAAVCERFRAILLTSLTTFAGLLPIMFETSLQAKFVTPMAISLGFSVLFSTAITLFLIPCLYVAGCGLKTRFKNTGVKLAKLRLNKA